LHPLGIFVLRVFRQGFHQWLDRPLDLSVPQLNDGIRADRVMGIGQQAQVMVDVQLLLVQTRWLQKRNGTLAALLLSPNME